MGRQREQMTLNNPDILFIHLSAPRKDETSVNEIFHVEARMHFGYLHANVQHIQHFITVSFSVSLTCTTTYR